MSDEKLVPVVGVLGGSGIYEIDGLENPHWEKIESPFGDPSDELLMGTADGVSFETTGVLSPLSR